jgi:hypothetical protein
MKVESYKIKGWEDKVTGVLISENENWILVKHIPIDYEINGYKIYAKKHIKKRIRNEREKQIERVLTLKKENSIEPTGFKFGTLIELLKWTEEKFGLFEFQDKSENELFYGKINTIQNGYLEIDMIKSNGKIEMKYDYKFKLSKIRSITFMTDYFESIRLLMKDELKNKM